jgi:predicted dehydrogenase
MMLDSTAQDSPAEHTGSRGTQSRDSGMSRDRGPALRLGLIGCGRIAQVAHLPAIAKSADVRLAAVSDPSPVLAHAVSQRYDVPGYTETEELLQAGLDAVLIAAPDRFHRDLGCRALQAGLHVLIEKPAAATSAEAADLRDLAAKVDRKVQVGAMRRHDPGIQYARAALDGLGAIASATFWYRLPTVLRASTEAALFPALEVDESVRSTEAQFKADRETYLLRTHGAHVFDAVRFLLGEVTQVRAELSRSGRDLHWRGSLRTTRAPVSFEISANVHANYAEGVEVFGEHGAVSIRSYFPFYRQASGVRVFAEQTLEWTSPDYGAVDPYQRQLEAFARAVRQGEPADPDAHDGVEALRLIEATAASAHRDGHPVDL